MKRVLLLLTSFLSRAVSLPKIHWCGLWSIVNNVYARISGKQVWINYCNNDPQRITLPAFISFYSVSFLLLPSRHGVNSLNLNLLWWIECANSEALTLLLSLSWNTTLRKRGRSHYMEENQGPHFTVGINCQALSESKLDHPVLGEPLKSAAPGLASVETRRRITQLIPKPMSDSQICEEINGWSFKPLWFAMVC